MDGREDGEVNVVVGFGLMHLLGEEGVVEKAVHDVLTAEAAADDVLPVAVVGVGEHVYLVPFGLELTDDVEAVLGYADAAGVPCVDDLLEACACGAEGEEAL